MKTLSLIGLFVFNSLAFSAPDWSEGATWSEPNRHNIFQLTESELLIKRDRGLIHALNYPVEVTGLLIPFYPLKNTLEGESNHPLRAFIQKIGAGVLGVDSLDDMESWLGLHPYPKKPGQGVFRVPFNIQNPPKVRMGHTTIKRDGTLGVTYSCAACHSGELFGKVVMGMTNKFPRANELFKLGKDFMPLIPHQVFRASTGASDQEVIMYRKTQKNLKWIGLKKPLALGLDTSLAQVGLSLAKREPDAYATKSKKYVRRPRPSSLEKTPADSKPAVWWNLKYKNRWLSDGSVVSGNPIYTNILWNELGRGTDLKELKNWLDSNLDTINELTIAAFSTKAPSYTDFFKVESINLQSAKRGEKIFTSTCVKCHGRYQKDWYHINDKFTSDPSLLKTVQVFYPKRTKVVNVGTDPLRYQGMESFAEDLNRLEISIDSGTLVRPQKGYVPPPLVGIWARWPYLHNNSVPTLYDLLSRPNERPKEFWMVAPKKKNRDFDRVKVGFPRKIASEFKKNRDYLYKTHKPGLTNKGHFRMYQAFRQSGFNHREKLDLIEFLKTL